MNGKHHVLTGISAAVTVDTAVKALSRFLDKDFYDSWHNSAMFSNIISSESAFGGVLGTTATIAAGISLFIIGSLLPDIDQENSTLGRFIHLPFQHRTWTHSVWLLLPLCVAAFFVPILSWLVYGCVLHIFFDSLSRGGICWFYPISKYKNWTSGAQVKKNHWFYLYRTGETSETVLTVVIVIMGAASLAYNILLTVNLVP